MVSNAEGMGYEAHSLVVVNDNSNNISGAIGVFIKGIFGYPAGIAGLIMKRILSLYFVWMEVLGLGSIGFDPLRLGWYLWNSLGFCVATFGSLMIYGLG